MKVTVTVAAVGGKTTDKTISVDGTGVSLGELMKAGNLSMDRMQATIDGRPADEHAHVGANSKVVLTERVAGS
jgi:hypothetical protein